MAKRFQALTTPGWIVSEENADVLAELVAAKGWKAGRPAVRTEIWTQDDIELEIDGNSYHMIGGQKLPTEDLISSVVTKDAGVTIYMSFQF